MRGFTLIELVVAMSIIIIITSVSLFHQAKFSSDILISNMAYEIALTIRQAQVFGTSSKGGSPSLANEQYRVGYGIHFAGDNSGSKPGTFITFIDIPTGPASGPGYNTLFNFIYDPSDPISSTIDLTQGEKIHRFCGHNSTGWNCWDSAVFSSNMTLDIVFVKPDPEAHITILNDGVPTTDYDQAKIVIESGLGDKCRTVTVAVSGQVSVDPIVSGAPNGGCDMN